MDVNRRAFIGAGAAALVASSALAAPVRIKAIAFDGLAILDARPIGGLAEQLFPGRGEALIAAWRTRQFEYTWLRSLTGRYADFWTVTDEALTFAAALLKIEVTPEQRLQLMDRFLALDAWPDVVPALRGFRGSGLKLALLTNFSPRMIDANARHAGLDGLFDHRLSTDQVQVYKPAPRAYQMGVDAFGLTRDEILFVAFAGWDAHGAVSFGYPTFWANRAGLPAEELGLKPQAIGKGMAELATYLEKLR